MKKVAIASCYFKYNYGSQLQALALQKYLIKNGIDCENIDISKLSDFSKGKKSYYKKELFNLKLYTTKLGMIKLALKKKFFKKTKLARNLAIRDNAFKNFQKNFLLSKKYRTYDELNSECDERYSDVIVGSDQLWLPVNVVADYYTLSFVPDSVNKISYATSLGVSYVPEKYIDLYERFLKRINHLSVREEKAQEIIKRYFGLDADCVCDPTMLLSGAEWEQMASSDKYEIKEPYIFCYFLGKSKWHREYAEKLSKITHCKIVSINHCDEYVKYSDKFADYAPYDVNPYNWINLIKNAKYVCTDSFHGTVFSILLHKQFFTFSRFDNKSKLSTNSRIQTLLKKFRVDDRLINSKEISETLISSQIDFNAIDQILEEYRRYSSRFLIDAITYNKKPVLNVSQFDKYDCCVCTACKENNS